MNINASVKKYGIIIMQSCRRFYTEKRLLWAASLTYTTIFSLIPLLSVLFFVFNIFGNLADLKTLIQPYIYKTLAPGAQETVLNMINNLVEKINFETIGVFSATVLIISVFLLLFEIEYALNEIWLIKQKISIISRAAAYWATLTIGPLILAVSLFIIVTLQSYKLVKSIEEYINPDIFSYLSYVLIWVAFTGIYFFMPGTKVRLWSALFGGIIAGTFWKVASIVFSIYTSKFFFYYPKVYGSLAAIPMFLLWIFVCWILLLLGAEITYFHQNYAFYSNSQKPPELTVQNRIYLTLLVLFFISEKYLNGHNQPSLSTIAYSLQIPSHIIREIIDPLLRHGILVESLSHRTCFVPGRPLSKIKFSEIVGNIRNEHDFPENIYNGYKNRLCKKLVSSLNSESGSIYTDMSIQEIMQKELS